MQWGVVLGSRTLILSGVWRSLAIFRDLANHTLMRSLRVLNRGLCGKRIKSGLSYVRVRRSEFEN